jgi:hypothetical protein
MTDTRGASESVIVTCTNTIGAYDIKVCELYFYPSGDVLVKQFYGIKFVNDRKVMLNIHNFPIW